MEKKIKIFKTLLVVISICFIIPSIIFLIKNKTVYNFTGDLEYKFLLTNNIDRLYQALVYLLIIILYIVFYYLIIKNRNKLFKDIKQILIYVLIVSAIFILAVPFWCSDIFYYLGIGRLASTYNQNPYYVDMKSYIDNNNIDIQNDTVMQKGYSNYWANTTVVYGAFWTIICSIISFLSFGNLSIGLIEFKILNLIIHMGNCYLLYKISKKKVFILLYGLNPFILIEGLANVHNDIFIVFFILLAIYEVYKRKNLVLGILFLAISTDIKYFSIILLPFFIIYKYKDKDLKTRIIKCIEYGLLFVVFVGIPYLLYIKDINVFMGLLTQRERIAKGFYLVISEYCKEQSNLVDIIKNISLLFFTIIYTMFCVALLMAKKIKFYKCMRELFYFMLTFLFLLITNFQPWYFMWLVPFMLWQKAENIKLIVQMQLMTLIANMVFLIHSENFIYGVPFFIVFVFGTLLCIIENKKQIIRRLQ